MDLAKVKLKTLLILPNLAYNKSDKELIGFNMPHLGMATLAGYLNTKKYKNIQLVDLRFEEEFANFDFPVRVNKTDYLLYLQNKNLYSATRKLIEKYNPDVVGFSVCISNQIAITLEISRAIKMINNKIKIIFGGVAVEPIVSKDSYIFYRKYFDAVIINDGEVPLAKFLYCLANKKSLTTVPNLYYKNKSGELVKSKTTFISDKRNLEILPNFDGLKFKLIPLRMSLGCPWGKCSFCAQKIQSDKYKYQAVDLKKLINNIKKLKNKYPNTMFLFYDEAISSYYIKKFSSMLIKQKINIFWGSLNFCLEPGFMDKSVVELMKKSGCKIARFGLESMSARILKLMNKIHNPESAIKILRLFNEVGINVGLNIIINFPTETVKECKITLDFLKKYEFLYSYVSFTRFLLVKNSYIYHHPKEFGITKMTPVRNELIDYIFDYKTKTYSGFNKKLILVKKFKKELKNKMINLFV